MGRVAAWVCGAATGATLGYFFDPDRGRRRRALLRDQALSRTRRIDDKLARTWRDLSQRARGYVYEISSGLKDDNPTDEVLVARVRSKIGRYVSNPGAVDVTARNGAVHLSGHVFNDELTGLVSAVRSVRGVRTVSHHLQAHDPRDIVPELQNRRIPPGERPNVLEEHWAPSTKAVVALTGSALLGCGLTRRDPLSCMAVVLGAGLLARACMSHTSVRCPERGLPAGNSAPSSQRQPEKLRMAGS